MKRLLLAAVFGLAVCLSVGAQTTTDQTQEPAQKERKAKPEQYAKPGQKRSVDESVQPKERQRAGAAEEQNAPPSTREGARTNEQRNVAHRSVKAHDFRNKVEKYRVARRSFEMDARPPRASVCIARSAIRVMFTFRSEHMLATGG